MRAAASGFRSKASRKVQEWVSSGLRGTCRLLNLKIGARGFDWSSMRLSTSSCNSSPAVECGFLRGRGLISHPRSYGWRKEPPGWYMFAIDNLLMPVTKVNTVANQIGIHTISRSKWPKKKEKSRQKNKPGPI